MQVMNYYKLSDEELAGKIAQIRQWIFDNSQDKRYKKAYHALEVALCAQELREDGIDKFTQSVIDNLTE